MRTPNKRVWWRCGGWMLGGKELRQMGMGHFPYLPPPHAILLVAQSAVTELTRQPTVITCGEMLPMPLKK